MLRDHLARVLLQATAHTTHTTQLADPSVPSCLEAAGAMSQRFDDSPVWLPIVNLAPFWATRRLLAHVSHRGPSHTLYSFVYLVPLTNPLQHLGPD
ncbi:uncharacterized protein BBA_08202 [Beauveria bassiana ARSEF 2860]|uniref:Uncharacterized protein n=1 Tax=Beauveria bassiana (strain ARSEF 2860) TaxID=655819 RepID=J4VWP4_BEAB2|nr:uncharacterized protein BBA_08202 [Beauveria bassiana ARSEF 2860]EJP62815.1 hypothetical protein BBA_08202 [Beauveria bassiana ARSEF 2860]